jgi:hypothetical protein
VPSTAVHLRNEALLMLEGKGAILETARRISHVFRESGSNGAVVGGIAVLVHGHIRTTAVVDVWLPEYEPALLGRIKCAASRAVPVNFLTLSSRPKQLIDVDGVRTVSLADLINMKLRSGTRHTLRAQDLADVIGLIRAHKLGGEFARHIDKPLRNEFRKLARAVKKETS